MGTKLRAELSEKNKYWIDKHRYYELKHFCLQYPMWKKAYKSLEEIDPQSPNYSESIKCIPTQSSTTEKYAIAKVILEHRLKMIEKAAYEADEEIGGYILKGVTEELSYTYLKAKLNMPCGKDMYYDRYRRFFWLLSKSRR